MAVFHTLHGVEWKISATNRLISQVHGALSIKALSYIMASAGAIGADLSEVCTIYGQIKAPKPNMKAYFGELRVPESAYLYPLPYLDTLNLPLPAIDEKESIRCVVRWSQEYNGTELVQEVDANVVAIDWTGECRDVAYHFKKEMSCKSVRTLKKDEVIQLIDFADAELRHTRVKKCPGDRPKSPTKSDAELNPNRKLPNVGESTGRFLEKSKEDLGPAADKKQPSAAEKADAWGVVLDKKFATSDYGDAVDDVWVWSRAYRASTKAHKAAHALAIAKKEKDTALPNTAAEAEAQRAKTKVRRANHAGIKFTRKTSRVSTSIGIVAAAHPKSTLDPWVEAKDADPDFSGLHTLQEEATKQHAILDPSKVTPKPSTFGALAAKLALPPSRKPQIAWDAQGFDFVLDKSAPEVAAFAIILNAPIVAKNMRTILRARLEIFSDHNELLCECPLDLKHVKSNECVVALIQRTSLPRWQARATEDGTPPPSMYPPTRPATTAEDAALMNSKRLDKNASGTFSFAQTANTVRQAVNVVNAMEDAVNVAAATEIVPDVVPAAAKKQDSANSGQKLKDPPDPTEPPPWDPHAPFTLDDFLHAHFAKTYSLQNAGRPAPAKIGYEEFVATRRAFGHDDDVKEVEHLRTGWEIRSVCRENIREAHIVDAPQNFLEAMPGCKLLLKDAGLLLLKKPPQPPAMNVVKPNDSEDSDTYSDDEDGERKHIFETGIEKVYREYMQVGDATGDEDIAAAMLRIAALGPDAAASALAAANAADDFRVAAKIVAAAEAAAKAEAAANTALVKAASGTLVVGNALKKLTKKAVKKSSIKRTSLSNHAVEADVVHFLKDLAEPEEQKDRAAIKFELAATPRPKFGHRANFDPFAMVHGDSLEISPRSQTNKIRLGVGWEPVDSDSEDEDAGGDIDLDLTVLAYSGTKFYDQIDFSHLRMKGA
jgi:hypothetical protein